MPARPQYASNNNKPFWENGTCRVFQADCRLVSLEKKYQLVFADPPFNIDQDYQDFKDKLKWSDYISFTESWIKAGWAACLGVMALHGPDNAVPLYLQNFEKYGISRIAWVIWHYRFGQCGRGNWINSHAHCLIAGRKGHRWNPQDVLVTSDRVAYGDKRTEETFFGGSRVPLTVWGIPSDGEFWGRVPGNSKERVKECPNQLPERYLERLIRAYTSPGDRILDMFGGSGTTAVVAQALGRKCDIIEIGSKTCQSIVERVIRGAVRI